MRLGTHLECVRSSSRVSGACQDGVREFVRRRPRLVGRLSRVAERLAESWEEIPVGCRNADRPLPGGTAKNRPSTVDFNRRRPIEGEIDRQRLIEGEGKKKKKRKRRKKEKRRKEIIPSARALSPPVRYRRPRVASTFSPTQGDETSPRAGRKNEATSPLFFF
ncbi:hypothetical protein GW17_00034495 [Ensete ventricosum]|nr:hypothetical protein GW17_00034495 [Ensete ventricosum]RZS06434.1 hypothetical protein BHM03_00037103 [Ensete ventricosum]